MCKYLLMALAVGLFPAGQKGKSDAGGPDQALAKLKILGAQVVFDKKSPGSPVVEIILPPRVTDQDLVHLKRLITLQRLELSAARITDAGLANLQNLTNLKYLGLNQTDITDAGLEHLKKMAKLQTLGLGLTSVSDRGLRHGLLIDRFAG